jgi:WD40 repeat protein/energy-coupling factor transporter ATP-binding protein EcfA2
MFSRNLAFIIGINNYNNGISPLKTAVNDAKKLVEILREKHNYQVWICLDEVATLNNLNQLLEKTLPEQVTENDRLLFYFAGHGVALNNDNGPAGYLIPQDAYLHDIYSYLPMTKLHDALNKLPCRHFLGILDCCFSGAFRWSSTRDLLTTPEVIHKERYDRFIADSAWQIITSSASDQKALDNFKLDTERGEVNNHSPFAAALLKALEGEADSYPPAKNGKAPGDGVITATELYLHLRDKVEIPTKKHHLRQTPGIWCLNKHDKGEYIFLSPGHKLNLPPAPPLDESKNPYRGLKSFDEEHCELFFGRSKLVEKLHNFVKTHSLTVVLGASGSGKSSLVKAGLIPKLKEATEKWCILSLIRPGDTPFQALNNVLADAQLPKVELQNKQKTLAQSIDFWVKKNTDSKLLIFIDQSEEVITLCHSENDRKEFFQQILTAINVHRDKLRVVLTLRSDFEPQIRDAGLKFVPEVMNQLDNTELKNRWQSGRFIVPAMTRGELREAIEKPAETRVMYFQPHDLVEQLINEVDNMPGALPLLSFALSELFLKYLKRQRVAEYTGITIDRALTQADYQELGGVMQSLTQRADEEYQALVRKNSAYSQVVRHVMLRMIALSGGELARRRVSLSELEYPQEKNSLVKEVIEGFTKARLLVKGEDSLGDCYVEPAHDALVRGWERLLRWKQEQEESLILQRRLTPSAVDWQSVQGKKQPSEFQVWVEAAIDWFDNKLCFIQSISTQVRLRKSRADEQINSTEKPLGFLWDANPYLDVLNGTLKSGDNWLNQVEVEFVRRSIKRRRRNIQRRWIITLSIMWILSGLTIWALVNLRNTKILEITALIEASESKLASNNRFDAMLEAIKAKKKLDNLLIGRNDFTPRILGTLQKAVHHNQQGWKEHLRLRGTNVIFSPDGKYLATIENRNIVRVWNVKTGNIKELPITEDKSGVRNIVFSPDGKLLAIASKDKTLRVLEVATGKQKLLPMLKGESEVNNIVFSPDGKLLAIASNNKTLRVLEVATGKQKLLPMLKGESEVNNIVFSPDGKLLAIASKDKTLRVLEVVSGKQKQLPIHEGESRVRNMVFSRANVETGQGFVQLLATVSVDNKVQIWNLVTGKQLPITEDKSGVRNTLFSPDGKLLAIASWDNTVQISNVATGKKQMLRGHESGIRSMVFSQDSQWLATASDDKTARVWDAGTGQQLQIIRGHESGVNKVEFSPDRKLLATSSWDKTSRVWNVPNLGLFQIAEHNNRVWSAVFSPDNQQVATASGDNKARLWNAATGKLLHTLEGHEGEVKSLVFSPDGKLIATASWDNTARVWDATNGKRLHILEGHKDEVWSVVFSPDGKRVATASEDKTARVWNTLNGKELHVLQGHESGVSSVVFSSDGKRVATASDDKTARLWDAITGKELHALIGHKDEVSSVVFSPDGKQVATASEDKTARLWNADNGKELYALIGHENGVNSIVFSPDGKRVATASKDKTARLWDAEDGKKLYTLSGQIDYVWKVVFSADGKRVATASDDKTARVWDVVTGKELQVLWGHESYVTNVAFSPDGKRVATASDDQTARIWDATTSQQQSISKGDESVQSMEVSLDTEQMINVFDKLRVRQNQAMQKTLTISCDRVRHYLEKNPNLEESDRHLCEGI